MQYESKHEFKIANKNDWEYLPVRELKIVLKKA